VEPTVPPTAIALEIALGVEPSGADPLSADEVFDRTLRTVLDAAP